MTQPNPTEDQILVSSTRLTELSRHILLAAGASRENADAVTQHLVDANLAGHDSHGVIRLPEYVSDIENRRLDPSACPRSEATGSAMAVIDGQWGFGQVSGNAAIDVGVNITARAPVALIGIRRCHHLGRLGAYAERATAQQRVLVAMAGGHTPIATVHGGRDRSIGANPIAIGFPTSTEPVVMDFATTAVAAGKVYLAAARGTKFDSPVIVTPEGGLSSDPRDFISGGGLLPFGGHKGSALAVMMELLTSALVAPDTEPDLPQTAFARQAGLFIVIRADALATGAQVVHKADDIVDHIRQGTPLPEQLIHTPGEPEQSSRQHRLRDGIPVERNTIDTLLTLAEPRSRPGPTMKRQVP